MGGGNLIEIIIGTININRQTALSTLVMLASP
jgi:hypothetical protein